MALNISPTQLINRPTVINNIAVNQKPVNLNSSPQHYYLNVLSEWPASVALASLWFVVLDIGNVPALRSRVSTNISNLESNGAFQWGIQDGTIKELVNEKYQTKGVESSLIGCVFARQVGLPGESLTAGHEGLTYGGYQSPATVTKRNVLDSLKITFLETNSSFCDFVIRPWIVLTGYYGLVARSSGSPKNVKCNFIDVYQFAKNGYQKAPKIRKMVRFHNVAPYRLNSTSFSQNEEGITNREVDFVYDTYSVMDYAKSSKD
jgi:hypothetical protein